MSVAIHWPLLAVGLAGCFGLNSAQDTNGTGSGSGSGTTSSGSSNSSGGSGTTGVAACSGIPAQVATLLTQKCVSCHGNKLTGGAPMKMVTYDDLLAPAPSDSSRTVAEVSMERMQSADSPMPPGSKPTVAQSDLDAFQAWLDSGTTADGTCDADAGGGVVVEDTPTVCTSGKNWPSRGRENADMNPGRACIDCHLSQEGNPIVTIGGTVYPTVHEPDLCYGSTASDVKVVITDANDKVTTLSVGSTGNFSLRRGTMAFPIRAKVVRGADEREMQTPQDSGDCNSCHTEQGEQGAPGRIFEP